VAALVVVVIHLRPLATLVVLVLLFFVTLPYTESQQVQV
jgi:hypothetical protein